MVNRVEGLDMEAVFEKVKNWGRWGEDDQRGALNLITEKQVLRAAGLVRDGTVVSCALELPVVPSIDNPTPAQHMMLIAGDSLDATGYRGLQTAIDYVGVAFHGMAVSHMDALCHVFVDGQMYNGRPATAVKSIGASANSIEAAFNGVAGRGVLLDVPLLRGVDWLEPTDLVTPDDLDSAERAANVTIEPGDIVLVRTGRDARRDALGPWDPLSGLAGLDPRCVEWIRDRDIAVLGSDGISDPLPNNDSDWPIPVHMCCLVGMGVHLLDNLQLSRLSAACRRLGRAEFLFSVTPLRITGATGSPVNPVAIL
ncbi:MAG TPA: cyclase family protein [Acidimicrobiales bacterium]|nr:cyclase family protein [Acidimicrobiales bacterium]